ncbi:hypothetical protein QA640_37765 [Bradyrhizobium sp. CB82]|uniref:hypothetical protein n=1 Tax=Bradyrhizobium sp. CB82 TaxID=3039159 RepID=UPI0024B1852A|nr:hypothetical protein [Bradyrhizobium sp. CB82]WFU45253.1 hypothetical protein QA640_37765 [Bradyrhizobium sp. CB82]
MEQRIAGLHDEPRSGGRTIDDARIEAVIVRTLESCPENATHWSSRAMAKTSGLSVSTVQRIWWAFGLRPHRMETFKLSTDPNFGAKVCDVVGLYVSPPEHAIVLCVDEKSQIQRWTAASRCCRCVPARRPEGAMTTKGMAPHRCSPPSILRPGGSSASATGATAPRVAPTAAC